MIDSVLILRGLEEMYPEIRFIERLRHCIEHFPEENWGDAMSRGQITSKQWIIHQLVLNQMTHLGRVVVCGGWIGILPRLIHDSPNVHAHHIESIDIDLGASIAAGELNEEYIINDTFLARQADAYYFDYSDFDTVINTSCEHFEDFYTWWERIPSGKLVILQSNDFLEPEDHVNTHCDLDDFVDNLGPLKKTIFIGTLPTYKYNRFMVIGVK